MLDETPPITLTEERRQYNHGLCSSFTAPLGSLTHGRLRFASGVTHVEISAGEQPDVLYTAHFETQIPSVRVQDGIITLQYRRQYHVNGAGALPQTTARIALNRSIPWEIECREGVAHLNADLRDIELVALDMGSVSAATFILPVPNACANIYCSGSVSDLTLHRPVHVGLRLQITGAASYLQLDEQQFGATSGPIRWQSANDGDTVNRYDMSIAGSVSNLTVACI